MDGRTHREMDGRRNGLPNVKQLDSIQQALPTACANGTTNFPGERSSDRVCLPSEHATKQTIFHKFKSELASKNNGKEVTTAQQDGSMMTVPKKNRMRT